MSFMYATCECKKLRSENEAASNGLNFYARQSKRFEKETIELKEEIQSLKTSNEGLLKQITELNSDKEKKEKEENNLMLIEKISELQQIIESARLHASMKDSDFSKLTEEKKVLELKCADLQKKFSELESATKIDLKEKKSTELRCISLCKQITDFEKLLFQEQETQDKERKEFEEIKKNAEKKHSAVLKELSDKRKVLEQRFEEERRLFKTEIMKLTKKLADLSTAAMIDGIQNTTGFYKRKYYSPFIRSSNIFFDKNVDRSCTYKSSFSNEKFVWKKKDQRTAVPDVKKNNAPNDKSSGKPKLAYTKDQMLSLSKRKFYCSYCHTHSVNHKTSDHFWYNSYSITPTRTATNISGPKYQWVPKSKPDSVLQAPHSKGK